MRATATAVARARPAGGVVFPVLRSAPPLTLRPTGTARLSIAGSAAGPLGGDVLALDLRVERHAQVEVTSIAAGMALPSPRPDGQPSPWSRMHVDVHVAAAAHLHWHTEPLIVCAAARHITRTRVRLDAGATLRWREVVVLGRAGEAPGSVRAELTADLGGSPLLRHELRLGPGERGWDGPAGTGGARVVGSELVVGPDAVLPAAAVDGAARLPLEHGPACLVTAVGTDVRTVTVLLDELAAAPPVATLRTRMPRAAAPAPRDRGPAPA